jgi:hypothetical protein
MKKPIFIVSFILSIVCAPVYTQSFLSLSSVPGLAISRPICGAAVEISIWISGSG